MSVWLFTRALSLIYFIAFVSYGVQVRALVGENGILPASRFITLLETYYGAKRFVAAPSLFLFHLSDSFLSVVCIAGALLAILAFLGIAQSICFLLLWFLYLSLINVSQDFLSFQWDILLVEAGFLAIFLAPFWPEVWNPTRAFFVAPVPPKLIHYLFLFLAIRLMFSSGVVKLSSGDETWRNLTAMAFHYETQPIPNPLAWIAHQAPLWAQKISCALMFVVELVFPFLLLAPGKFRLVGVAGLIGLQVLILSTGNYAFFNLLSIALCLFAIDDAWIARALPWLQQRLQLAEPAAYQNYLAMPLALVLGLFGVFWTFNAIAPQIQLRRFFQTVLSPVSGFHLSNPYGLFAVMTTERPEIIVEGSRDGVTWLPYEFKYKPGRLDRMPPIVAPHQPRLDWQMWFAALGPYERSPWFQNFLARLLQNNADVTSLLAENPFKDSPPRMVRSNLYLYHLAPPGSKDWWIRLPRGEYGPVLELQQGAQ